MPLMIEFKNATWRQVVFKARTQYPDLGRLLDRGRGWVLLDDDDDNVMLRYDGKSDQWTYIQLGYEL